MDNMSPLNLMLNDPGRAVDTFLHQGSTALPLLVAAGLLGTFGVGIAAQAFLRGKDARFSWGNLAANVGGLAWLLPVAAVFALYGFWMRPNLFNLPDTWSVKPQKRSLAADDPELIRPRFAPVSVESGTTLPEWVQEKDSTADNARFVVVTGEIGSTVEEAATAARSAAIEVVRDDFAASYPQVAGWEPPAPAVGAAAIRRTFVEEIDRKTLSSGVPFRVYRAYDQVELSPVVRRQIFPFWKEEIVDRRILALGGLAGLLTLTFATLAAYFRLDERTSGLFRSRLKLATVCVIAAGGFAAATLL
jgi:hypothetical protein